MSDLDFSKAFTRLKVENDFLCKRNFDLNIWHRRAEDGDEHI